MAHDTRSVFAWKLAVLATLLFLDLVHPQKARAATTKLNVLLIMVDDLRPELGAYGVNEIQTPNIDELAQQGVAFTRAYAQIATCSPSRTSMLTGLRPDTTRVTDLKTHFRDTIASVVTLPEYFKAKGYQTQGICKIYHGGLDDARSWSVPYVDLWGQGAPKGADGKPMAYAAVDAPESGFTDGKCADAAMEALQNLQGQPFFLAVGFKKPHLPFVAPPQYFNMYNQWGISEASNPFRATGAPEFAFDDSAELRSRYSMMPPLGEPFTRSLQRELKRGYYAAVSFVDAQIGRVLSEVARLGLEENTVVVLVGDHGWHLGEQDEWGKHTNFEVGTRVPLIIRAPGQAVNQKSTAIVELVDLYPTITELAGLPIPTSWQHGGYPLEGESLSGMVANPSLESNRGAISQWRRGGYAGHSIRTDQYRFTEWAASGKSAVYELYDHVVDPDETINLASEPEYASVIPALRSALAARGQQDLPLGLLPETSQPGACGQPSYDKATEAGVFLWNDCGTNNWHLRVTGGGQKVTFEGSLTSDRGFTSMTPFSYESSDVLPPSYVMNVGNTGQDGLDFSFQGGAAVCLTLNTPNLPVYVGADRAPMGSTVSLPDFGPCNGAGNLPACGEPNYDKATETGVFLWNDCGTNNWHVRATAGGQRVTYTGSLTASDRFTTLTGFSFELPWDVMPPNYSMTVVNAGQDGLDFSIPSGTRACLTLDTASLPIFAGSDRVPMGRSVSTRDYGACTPLP